MDQITIFLWGCHPFSRCLHQLLAGTNVQVAAFIDDKTTGLADFCGKPVLAPHAIKETWPIVVTVDHFMFLGRPVLRLKNINQFKAKLQEIIREYPLKNTLLHPAALVDFLALRYPNKVILFGLQGSGNVVFVNILQAIYKKYLLFLFTKNRRGLFFELMCREYMNIVHQVMTDFIHLNGGYDTHAVAWKIGTSHLNCKFAHQHEASLYTFATREHVFSFVSMYHQIPSRDYLHKLRGRGFKLYFVQRSPLDIILSGVNKSSGISAQSGQMDSTHFQCISRWTIAQLSEWHPLVHDMPVLRYESLLENPARVIKTIMKQVGVLPLAWVAKKIWEQVGFKQLPQAFKNHFWRGGRGKWETYFKPEHLLYLQAYGIEELLQKYDYQEELARFRILINAIPQEEAAAFNGKLVRVHDRVNCYKDETYDTFEFLQQMNEADHCWQSDCLSVVCKDEKRMASMKATLGNAYIHAIVLAGSHPQYKLN